GWLDVGGRLGGRRATEVVQPKGSTERKAQYNPHRHGHFAKMFRANEQHPRAKDKQQWPSETDDAPGRFVFDVTISDQASHAVDRQITQAEVLKLLAKQAED